MAANRRRQADGDAPDRLVARGTQVLLGLRHRLQDADSVVIEALPGLGHRHAPAVAQQQGLAQIGLQQPDLAAQRWLGNVQHAGGLAEAAQLGDMDEIVELAKVHGVRSWPSG